MDSGPVHIVVMGVAATGKSAVASELAARLGFDFIEGDSHHPPANVAKIAAGIPLDDADRMPWLRSLAGLLAGQHAEGRATVLTCSALRRRYRDVLRASVPPKKLFFLHLDAPFALLQARMFRRTGHFMPPALLRSQFDTLERLEEDEVGGVVDVSGTLEDVVTRALALVRSHLGR